MPISEGAAQQIAMTRHTHRTGPKHPINISFLAENRERDMLSIHKFMRRWKFDSFFFMQLLPAAGRLSTSPQMMSPAGRRAMMTAINLF